MFTGHEPWIWLHEPEHRWEGDRLTLVTRAETGFWQGTHVGYRRDNGHALITDVHQDFSLTTRCTPVFTNLQDQAGLIVRIDAENWITASICAESTGESSFATVVTNHGYSDWSCADIGRINGSPWVRLEGKGADILAAYSENGKTWRWMRVAHLHAYPGRLSIGIYASSPHEGEGFEVCFDHLDIGARLWEDA